MKVIPSADEEKALAQAGNKTTGTSQRLELEELLLSFLIAFWMKN